MFNQIIFIFKYFLVCLFFVCILFILPFLFVFQKPDYEKLSPYECGFNPYGDARMKFEIHFYLIAILFIIFDLEIAILFPFSVALTSLNIYGISSMCFFILILFFGFLFEFVKGALE